MRFLPRGPHSALRPANDGWIANRAGYDPPPDLSPPPWSFGWLTRSTRVLSGAALYAACLGLVDFHSVSLPLRPFLSALEPSALSPKGRRCPTVRKDSKFPLSPGKWSSGSEGGTLFEDVGVGCCFRAPEVLPLKGPQSRPCGSLTELR